MRSGLISFVTEELHCEVSYRAKVLGTRGAYTQSVSAFYTFFSYV